VRKLRKDRVFKWLKNSAGELRLEVSRRRRELCAGGTLGSRTDSQRRERTVRISWKGFAKSRQPSDQPEEQGGYGCIQSSSSRGCESSDHHPVNRQPSGSTGVAQDLSPREQRETPEKTSGIWSSGFIQVKWLDFAFG
jgi:hypothetical protein